MRGEHSHKNFTALVIVVILIVLVYLMLESWQRSNQIDKALKQIPSIEK